MSSFKDLYLFLGNMLIQQLMHYKSGRKSTLKDSVGKWYSYWYAYFQHHDIITNKTKQHTT